MITNNIWQDYKPIMINLMMVFLLFTPFIVSQVNQNKIIEDEYDNILQAPSIIHHSGLQINKGKFQNFYDEIQSSMFTINELDHDQWKTLYILQAELLTENKGRYNINIVFANKNTWKSQNTNVSFIYYNIKPDLSAEIFNSSYLNISIFNELISIDDRHQISYIWPFYENYGFKNEPYIILQLDEYMGLLENQSNVLSIYNAFYLKKEIINFTNDLDELLRISNKVNLDIIDKWGEVGLESSEISLPLQAIVNQVLNDVSAVSELIFSIFLPLFIIFQILAFYFLNNLICNKSDIYNLLHKRGFTYSKLNSNLFTYIVLLPLIINIIIILLYSLTLNSQNIILFASLIGPWIITQLFISSWISMKESKRLQYSKHKNTQYNPNIKFQFYYLFGIITLIFFIIFIQDLFSIHIQSIITPKYIPYIIFTIIFMIISIIFWLIEKKLPKKVIISDVNNYFGIKQIFNKRFLFTIILFLSIIIITVPALNSPQHRNVNFNGDLSVEFQNIDINEINTFNFDKLNQKEEIKGYALNYYSSHDIRIEQFDQEFSLSLVNESLFDTLKCTNCEDTSYLTNKYYNNKLWVNIDTYNLFSDDIVMTLSDGTIITFSKSIFSPVPKTDLGITDKLGIATSFQYWSELGLPNIFSSNYSSQTDAYLPIQQKGVSLVLSTTQEFLSQPINTISSIVSQTIGVPNNLIMLIKISEVLNQENIKILTSTIITVNIIFGIILSLFLFKILQEDSIFKHDLNIIHTRYKNKSILKTLLLYIDIFWMIFFLLGSFIGFIWSVLILNGDLIIYYFNDRWNISIETSFPIQIVYFITFLTSFFVTKIITSYILYRKQINIKE